MEKQKLSIIIPSYNEEKYIGECLRSLLNQTYRKFEIIVVDDGSTDNTSKIVERLAKKDKRIKLIKGKHKGPGFSRNLGAKISKGKILVFVDADMTFDKNYLKELTRPIIQKKTIGCEDGRQIASNQYNIWSRCWGAYFKDYCDIERGRIFRAILKKEFSKMGGFDPSLGYADDLTFYIKYGVTSLRVPTAVCYHKNPETLKEVYKQSRWIGASLDYWPIRMPVIKYFVPFILIVISPLAIPVLAIKKCYKNEKWKGFKLLIPWMLIFMTVRYFGTISGLFRRIYLNKNVR